MLLLHLYFVNITGMHISTVCFQVALLREALEAQRTLKRLLFVVLATVVHCIAFPVCHIGTYGTEVDLGPMQLRLPTPYVALNVGHSLQTIWEGMQALHGCHESVYH